jgi:hypothetical protein
MATITWTGAAGDGNFSNPANWSPMQVPGAADSAIITPSAITAISIGNVALEALTTSKSVTLTQADNTSLTIGSGSTATTFTNAGTYLLNSSGDGTNFEIGATKVMLTGGGTVALSNNGSNRILAASASDTLTNVNNTITGAGQLGAGTLTLVNNAGGTIIASDSNALVLNTGASITTNNGLMEATNTGGLTIQTTVNSGTSGVIKAAGGNVFLQNGTLQGGTLSSTGSAAIAVSNGTFDGTAHTVTNTGAVVVNDNTGLTLLGTFTNNGTVTLNSTGDGTEILVGPGGKTAGTVTLTGGGHIILSDNGSNYIQGTIAGDTLVNVNDTISGAGRIGAGQLNLVNDATISATGTNAALYIDTGSTTINNALLEASGPAGLVIQSAINNSGGGTILASGGNVYLQSTISGGVLNSVGTANIVAQNATLDGAAQAVTNSGTIDIADNTRLNFDGTINNTGVIAFNSSGDATDLVATGATATLTGSGTLLLSANTNNRIYGATSATVIDNVNNTIEGSGQIGASQLTFINGGIIDANNSASALYLNGDVSITNTHLIEATSGAALYVQSTSIANNGGTLAASGGSVLLQNATVAGGVLQTSASGTIYAQGATLDGSVNTLTNTGQIQVSDNNNLSLLGTIVNSGTMTLASTGDATSLISTAATVTLTGDGVVLLGGSGASRIYSNASGDSFVNVNNTIEGAGQLGAGSLVFTNDAAGVIDANAANALIVNTGGGAFTNMGLMEATAGGGLTISSTITNSGTILANGGNVTLNDGAAIAGGSLVSNGGTFFVQGGTFDGTNGLHSAANVVVVDNNNLNLLGTITNTGTINLESGGDSTNLIANSATVTLTGAGVISLSDNGQNRIYGSAGGTVIDNVNNTIQGAGQLGAGQVVFINEAAGIIDATGTNALFINADSFTNRGLIEATGTGGLVIQSVITNSGTIAAAGGNVSLIGGTIAGGTLVASHGGAFYTSNATLDGSAAAIVNDAAVTINDNTTLNLLGAIDNVGTITLASSGDATDLVINSPTVTLTGSGVIHLSDNGQNQIYGASGADVLNNVNNTIAGSGQFGAGQLTYINATGAIVDASGSQAALVINTDSFANSGLVESTGAGGMVIESLISNGTAGRISAAGGNISINGGDIAGGTLTSSGGAEFYINGGTLDGSANAVINKALIHVDDNQTLYVDGTINNTGTITIASSGDATTMLLKSAEVQLTGNGTLALTDNGQNLIYGASTSDILDNVGNTIEGSGQLGDGQMTLINNAIIEATGSNALVISLGSTGTNTASGQLLGIGAGGLVIENGTYSNSGLIEAMNGSSVTFESNATLTNSSKGTLTGGTYAAIATGNGATLSLSGSVVSTLGATMILSGAGSEIYTGGATIESSLKSIGVHGDLQILAGRAYTTTNKLSVQGSLVLGGGVLTTTGLTTKSAGTIAGFGTLAGNLTSGGALQATGGVLELTGLKDTISGAVTGTGTLEIGKGTATFDAGASLSVATIAVIGGANLALNTSLSFAGVLDVIGKTTISGTGAFTNTGLFEETGTGTATVSAAFTNDGTISASSGLIAFTGGLTNAGLILDNAHFTDTAALTGGSLSIGGAGTSAVIASGAGAGNSTVSTLTIGGGTLNTSGTTLTVTGDYNNTAAGVGNAYNPDAGVTGTIDGQGTQLTVVGVDGTTITTVNGTATITVAKGGTASFVIENTGAAGSAALRGALQTTVNGGHITAKSLSGSGVTAQDFGAIAAGGQSGTFTIAYGSGTLSNQAIHFESDFANVAGLTIDIVAGTAAASVPPSSSHAFFHDAPAALALLDLPHHW